MDDRKNYICREKFQENRFYLGHKPRNLRSVLVFIVIGVISLVWFLIRTGKRPDRIRYPCQKIAGANSLIFISWLFSLAASQLIFFKNKKQISFLRIGAVLLSLILLVTGFSYFRIRFTEIHAQVSSHPPICPNNNCSTWSSPKVVSVKDNAVMGSSIAGDYYSDTHINQAVVTAMMDRGILNLTGTSSVKAAWTKLFTDKFGHDYLTGQKIGIKVNWNNSDSGYGSIGLFNPLPQTAAAILKELTVDKGIAQDNIYIYDCTQNRKFYSYFTDNLWSKGYSNIHYVGAGVDSSYPVIKEIPVRGTLVSSDIDNDTYWCGQVQNTFNYIINVPLFKAHGGDYTGVSLGFKNHFGSLINPLSLDHLSAGIQTAIRLIDASSYIEGKTVITIGDGLYAADQNNTSPPSTIYQTLFFGQDPVALDSVMFDHLRTFAVRTISDIHQQYLHDAAAFNGMGVHEHWNTATRQYSKIVYSACSSVCPGVTVLPTITGVPSVTSTGTPPTSPTITFSPPLTPKPGDTNWDSKVDGEDYIIWMKHYQPGAIQSGGYTIADFNNDMSVDGVDYSIWGGNYGK